MGNEQYDVVTDRKGQLILLILVFVITMMDGLDSSIVTLTLPTIASDLNCDVANSSWILSAYIIGIAAPLLAFTKIVDKGRIREFFIIGTFIFGLSSLFCGMTTSFEQLAIARFVQGVGASMMGSTGPIIVIRMLPADMKGRGMSVLAIASGISLILGPPLGGVIAGALSWHWIFFVNVPICVAIIILGLYKLPHAKFRVEGFPLDIPSVIYMALAITASLIFLENLVDCTVPFWLLIASGIVAVAMLVVFYIRLKRPGLKDRLISVEMFRNVEFVLVTFSFFLTTIIATGTEYLLPFFLQGPWEMDEMQSSFYFTIISVFTVIASLFAGKWCDSKGCRTPTAIAVLGRLIFSLGFALMVPSWGPAPLIAAMVVMGISYGLSGTSQSTRIIHHSKPEYQGEASAVLLLANYLGAALGVVVYAMMYSISRDVTGGFDNIIDGFHIASMLGAVLSIVALICTFAVRNIVPSKQDDGQAE